MDIYYNEMQTENTFTLYWKEVNWIAKNTGLDVCKFSVDDMTFGDPVVFYGGKYQGYLLSDFYDAFVKDDFDSWWFGGLQWPYLQKQNDDF